MKKYGDLCFEKNEKDIGLGLILEKVIPQSDKTFDGVWNEMLKRRFCEERFSVLYKNARILVNTKPEPGYDLLYNSGMIESKYNNMIRWESEKRFQENLSWYANNLSLYKKDIEMCLMFNLDLMNCKPRGHICNMRN